MKKIILGAMVFCVLLSVGANAETTKQEPGLETGLGALPARLIKVGDSIKISVWKYSDLDATLIVGSEGSVIYSYVGEIPVAGKTAEEVRRMIVEKLDQSYIANPKVDVKIETKSLTIFVAGEVLKPGSYPYEAGLDPLKAVALAGGFTDFASRKVVIVRQAPEGAEIQIKVNTNELMKPMKDREKYQLLPGDMVVVNRSWL